MSQKKLGPIGSAVLTFIGYKQTDRQTDRQAKFIYRFCIQSLVIYSVYGIRYPFCVEPLSFFTTHKAYFNFFQHYK